MARFSCTVSLDIPEGSTRTGVAAYILYAVQTMKGALRPPGSYSEVDPGDPMFELDRDSVSVTYRDEGVNYRMVDKS